MPVCTDETRRRGLGHPVNFKATVQGRLARRGEEVGCAVTEEQGPPDERTYAVVARVDGRALGSGSGRTKKHAEQEAAQAALTSLQSPSPWLSFGGIGAPFPTGEF